MGLLGAMFGKKTRQARTQLANLENRDLLQGIVYGCYYIAAADGELEQAELDKTDKLLRNCPQLKNFGSELNDLIDKAKKDFTDGGFRIIRMNAERELADLKNDPRSAETVLNMMITVAESDGEIEEPAETNVLKRAANILGLRLEEYL